MTTDDAPTVIETVELYVPNDERSQVARKLLAAADHPRDVRTTSDGFVIPAALFDKVYGQGRSDVPTRVPAASEQGDATTPDGGPAKRAARGRDAGKRGGK